MCNKFSLSSETRNLTTELINLRRDFHAHPELGFMEFRTSGIVAEYLTDLGLKVNRNIAGTGVSALLEGENRGKTLMLRADIDALPVLEKTNLSFSSKNKGVMHACGHDGHTAILLICAKILSEMKDKINGQIKFFFQPNEEDAAAEISIKEGVMKNPDVDAVFGYHLWSTLETGKIGIITGPVMASSYYFNLEIFGKGGHAGQPHTANNPIDRLMEIIIKAKQILSEEFDSIEEPTVISFCKISAGDSPTIIPNNLITEGSIRCLHERSKYVHARFKEIVTSICKMSNCEFNLEFKCGNNLMVNNSAMSEKIKLAAEQVVGKSNIVTENLKTMLGDDFSEFSNLVPGCYFFAGAGTPNQKTTYPHHHPKFDIDEDSLPIVVEVIIKSVLNYFNN